MLDTWPISCSPEAKNLRTNGNQSASSQHPIRAFSTRVKVVLATSVLSKLKYYNKMKQKRTKKNKTLELGFSRTHIHLMNHKFLIKCLGLVKLVSFSAFAILSDQCLLKGGSCC